MTGTASFSSVPLSAAMAFEAFTDSPRFKYRGCAPDVDDPTKAAGNPALSRNAWLTEDRDGAEPQKEREERKAAAVEVCLNCPVMVLCDRYAMSARPDGRLAEPRGIWGGRLEQERRELFERREKPAVVKKTMARAVPKSRLETPQKMAVLRALAMCWDPFQVAAAAGVSLRSANWQRSKMVSDLGLPKSASRERMLAVAVERGLVDAALVVPDGGRVPAVPAPVKTTAGARQLPVFSPRQAGPKQEKRSGGRRGVPRVSLREKFAAVPGQEGLMVAVPAVAEPGPDTADVHQLPVAETLGAVA
jgi:hypothetical protein